MIMSTTSDLALRVAPADARVGSEHGRALDAIRPEVDVTSDAPYVPNTCVVTDQRAVARVAP
jgi:hypothetical protein